jgi:hypothetical protein
MCGLVKPPRVECGPMHCRLPGQGKGRLPDSTFSAKSRRATIHPMLQGDEVGRRRTAAFRTGINEEKRPNANISRTSTFEDLGRPHQCDKTITNQVNLHCKTPQPRTIYRCLNGRSVPWPGIHRRMRRSRH